MKAVFPTLWKNELLRCVLGNASLKSSLAHAYIIEGAPGSGRHTAAFLTACAISCENRGDNGIPLPCLECPSCRKIMSRMSPDVLVYNRENEPSFKVTQVRAIKDTIYFSPLDNERKVYIIEEAELMTPAAQNALLLLLEDPPEYVLFFLLTRDSRHLLETVKSRAPILRTQELSVDELSAYLIATDAGKTCFERDRVRFDTICARSSGSIGKALDMLTDDAGTDLLGEEYNDALSLATALCLYPCDRLLEIVSSLTRDRTALLSVITLAIAALSDIASFKCGAAAYSFFTDSEKIRSLSAKIPLSKIMHTAELLYDAERKLATPLSSAAITGLLTSLAVRKGT